MATVFWMLDWRGLANLSLAKKDGERMVTSRTRMIAVVG